MIKLLTAVQNQEITPATPVWSRSQSQTNRRRTVSPEFKTGELSVGQRVEQFEVSPPEQQELT
jgi:hypothetical protein